MGQALAHKSLLILHQKAYPKKCIYLKKAFDFAETKHCERNLKPVGGVLDDPVSDAFPSAGWLPET